MTALKSPRRQTKIKPCKKGLTVNRPRETTPSKRTAEGLFALYLAHLIAESGVKSADLAKATGISRDTLFAWLRADSSPQVRYWPKLAKALGLSDWRLLVPPPEFRG